MEIEIVGRGIEVDEATREHVQKRFDRVGRQVAESARLEIVLWEQANPSIRDLDKRSALHESWDAVQTKQDERAPYYNVPGACAAAKLLTQSGGHIARGMTEMFFAPREPHQVTLRYQHLDRYHPLRVALHKLTCGQFGRSDPEREQAFDPGLTVPSCASCQALIPMVLCDVKRRTCP